MTLNRLEVRHPNGFAKYNAVLLRGLHFFFLHIVPWYIYVTGGQKIYAIIKLQKGEHKTP